MTVAKPISPRPLEDAIRRHAVAVGAVIILLVTTATGIAGEEASATRQPADWGHRTAYNYVAPIPERIRLAGSGHIVRPIWSYEIHTGINSSSAGPARELLAQGLEPTYGETGAAVVVDDVYILSWS